MIELLYAALLSPLGVVVETTDVERLRQKLYAIRREAKDEALAELSFVPSPTSDTQLWIVKKSRGSNGSDETERGDPLTESDPLAV